MSDYLLTEETRRHRLEEFNRMLPLVKATLDNWKQLLKERKRLRTYEKHEEEFQSAIETAEELIANEVFSSNETQVEMLKERIKELEDKMGKTTEFLIVFDASVEELENNVHYYEKYLINIMSSIVYDNEPILDKKDIDTKYIREYFYLMFVLKDYCDNIFGKEVILTQEAANYLRDFIREQREEGFYIVKKCRKLEYKSKMEIVELFEIFQ